MGKRKRVLERTTAKPCPAGQCEEASAGPDVKKLRENLASMRAAIHDISSLTSVEEHRKRRLRLLEAHAATLAGIEELQVKVKDKAVLEGKIHDKQVLEVLVEARVVLSGYCITEVADVGVFIRRAWVVLALDHFSRFLEALEDRIEEAESAENNIWDALQQFQEAGARCAQLGQAMWRALGEVDELNKTGTDKRRREVLERAALRREHYAQYNDYELSYLVTTTCSEAVKAMEHWQSMEEASSNEDSDSEEGPYNRPLHNLVNIVEDTDEAYARFDRKSGDLGPLMEYGGVILEGMQHRNRVLQEGIVRCLQAVHTRILSLKEDAPAPGRPSEPPAWEGIQALEDEARMVEEERRCLHRALPQSRVSVTESQVLQELLVAIAKFKPPSEGANLFELAVTEEGRQRVSTMPLSIVRALVSALGVKEENERLELLKKEAGSIAARLKRRGVPEQNLSSSCWLWHDDDLDCMSLEEKS